MTSDPVRIVGTDDQSPNRTARTLVVSEVVAEVGTYLQQIADLDPTIANNFIVSDGVGWTQKTAAEVGDILGLGIYGSLYAHEAAINVDISAVGQGVYVKITGLTSGELAGVTVVADAFRVSRTGMYKVAWSISADSQGNNKDYEVDIYVNGVQQADGSGRREFATVASLGSMSGSAPIRVTNIAHDVDLRIKEMGAGAGTDIDIFNLNFNITRIGD